jgi:hypothetical protein
MSYSPALTYFLDRLSGFSTNVFRLEAQNSNSASANKILRFTLPSNALLNMRSFALHFSASCAGTAAGGRLPPKIDTLIDRVEVSAGGVQLSAGANFYNVLRHAKDALEGDKTDPLLGHPDMVRAKSYVDNSDIATTDNEVYTTTNNETQFCVDKWEGFLGSCEPKIIDSSLLPDIVVSIYLADNNVLASCAGAALSGTGATDIDDDGSAAATYSLANIHATIECIGLAGSVYNNMVAGMIASAGFLEIPFKQYFSFQDTTSGNMRFTVATQSLDRIWVAHRQNNFGAQGGAVVVAGHKIAGAFVDDAAGQAAADIDIGRPGFDIGGVGDYNKEKYVTKFINFKEPDAVTSSKVLYQFQLNGAYYPQFRATFEEMSQISQNSVNYMGKKCTHSLHTAKTNYSVQCIRLNMPESEYGRLISGLDTRSVSLNGYYTMDNVNTGTYTPTVNLFCECSSTLRVGAGRMLEVIQ